MAAMWPAPLPEEPGARRLRFRQREVSRKTG
jgi:hypothetical protein